MVPDIDAILAEVDANYDAEDPWGGANLLSTPAGSDVRRKVRQVLLSLGSHAPEPGRLECSDHIALHWLVGPISMQALVAAEGIVELWAVDECGVEVFVENDHDQALCEAKNMAGKMIARLRRSGNSTDTVES